MSTQKWNKNGIIPQKAVILKPHYMSISPDAQIKHLKR